MKQIVLLILAISLFGAACNRQQTPATKQPYSDGTIDIAGRTIQFELADEPKEQSLGLGGRTGIEENQGMLFTFTVPDFPIFWMKDMNFPIDIIWLRHNEIVDISAEAQIQPGAKDEALLQYTPKQPSDYVLELKAGWAARNGLKIGDKVQITRHIQ